MPPEIRKGRATRATLSFLGFSYNPLFLVAPCFLYKPWYTCSHIIDREYMAPVAKDISLFEGVVPGMTIRIHQKIKDVNPKGEEKERIQIYEGMVIKRKGGSQRGATVTVRKISNGVGVEKIYPICLPAVVKVEKKKQAEVRRAKLYYLRTYKKKLKEKALA